MSFQLTVTAEDWSAVGASPAHGFLEIGLLRPVLGDTITTDKTWEARLLTDGTGSWEIPTVPADNALKVRSRVAGLYAGKTFYFSDPGAGPHSLTELIEDWQVDPTTLQPTPDVTAAWDAALAGSVKKAQNLSDLPDKAAARTNLGVLSAGEVSATYAPNRVPAYAGPRPGLFDAARSLYNTTAAPLRELRRALGKSKTGTCRIAFVGDSVTAGAGGAPGTEDPVTRLRESLQGLGYTVGEFVAAANASEADTRFVLSAGWVPGTIGFPYLYSSTTGASLTYTSHVAGTVVEIMHATSSGTFTYSIDGAAAVTVSTPGAPGNALVTVTGLPNTTHTVVITNTGGAAELFIAGFGVRSATGVVLYNAGLGGASSNDWAENLDWYGATGVVAFTAPDLVLIELGLNDGFYGTVPAATFAARLDTIVSHFGAAAAVALTVSQRIPDAHAAAIYDLADGHSIPLLDLRDRIGGDATTTAPLTGDGVHLTAIGNVVKGAALVDLITA